MVTVLPGQLIVGGCILVGLLFFHDETHVLIGLAARLQGKPVSMSACPKAATMVLRLGPGGGHRMAVRPINPKYTE